MRIRVLAVVLTGLAAGLISLAAGQQVTSAEPGAPQWRNLLGDVKALDQFTDFRSKYVESFNKHDASAMTAFYADDGIAITPDGWFSGHDAIQKWYEFLFQRWNPSESVWQTDWMIGTDSDARAIGSWWSLLQNEKGPVSASGYWSAEYIRLGKDWKIHTITYNVAGGIPLSPVN